MAIKNYAQGKKANQQFSAKVPLFFAKGAQPDNATIKIIKIYAAVFGFNL